MSEIEKMYKLVNVAKPVIKKWYYDGYYEDFSWQSSEEDCTELLKYFDNSIDKLNNRIQQMKKEENTKYDRYTDSVDTEFGRIEKAYIVYPSFTAEKQLELIKWLGKLDGKLEITCTYNKEKFIFNFYFNRKTDKNPDPKYPYSNFLNADIEILIASIINDIWQGLTEEEKQQVKGILE